MTKTIDTSFIGSFKLGDNICFNVGGIKLLYCKLGAGLSFNRKIITILNVSIIEALMIDFVRRVKIQTSEFKYLDEERRKAVRKIDSNKNAWKFGNGIKKFKHHRLLGEKSNYYENVEFLKNLRNRIHIQVQFGGKNETDAWTKESLRRSEICTEYTLRFLSENYPRSLDCNWVDEIVLPWEDHFCTKTKVEWKELPIGPSE